MAHSLGGGDAGPSPRPSTCFGQPAGAPGAGRAVAPGQHRHAAQAGRPGHGGPQAAARAVGVGAAPGPLLLGPLEFGLRAALPAPARPRRAVSVAPGARPSEKRTGTALRAASSGGPRGPSRESGLHETLLVNQPFPSSLLPPEQPQTPHRAGRRRISRTVLHTGKVPLAMSQGPSAGEGETARKPGCDVSSEARVCEPREGAVSPPGQR